MANKKQVFSIREAFIEMCKMRRVDIAKEEPEWDTVPELKKEYQRMSNNIFQANKANGSLSTDLMRTKLINSGQFELDKEEIWKKL